MVGAADLADVHPFTSRRMSRPRVSGPDFDVSALRAIRAEEPMNVWLSGRMRIRTARAPKRCGSTWRRSSAR